MFEDVIEDGYEEEEFIEETTLVGPAGPGRPMTVTESYAPSRASVIEESVVHQNPAVNTTIHSVGKQMSFYDRLRASKMGNSELLSGHGDVNSVSRQENDGDKELSFYQKLKKSKEKARENNQSQYVTYQSQKPEPL